MKANGDSSPAEELQVNGKAAVEEVQKEEEVTAEVAAAAAEAAPAANGDKVEGEAVEGEAEVKADEAAATPSSSTETPPTVEFGRDTAAAAAPVPATPMEAAPTPTTFSPRRVNNINRNLLDQLDEVQCRDGTVPLCRPELSFPKASPYHHKHGFWS